MRWSWRVVGLVDARAGWLGGDAWQRPGEQALGRVRATILKASLTG
jgi:hypothetical protein